MLGGGGNVHTKGESSMAAVSGFVCSVGARWATFKLSINGPRQQEVAPGKRPRLAESVDICPGV